MIIPWTLEIPLKLHGLVIDHHQDLDVDLEITNSRDLDNVLVAGVNSRGERKTYAIDRYETTGLGRDIYEAAAAAMQTWRLRDRIAEELAEIANDCDAIRADRQYDPAA